MYDENGQLLTGSLADYLMPTASDFPNIRSITLELKPCPNNPLGAKGAGEGGLIPVGGIMANAIADALVALQRPADGIAVFAAEIWQLVREQQASGTHAAATRRRNREVGSALIVSETEVIICPTLNWTEHRSIWTSRMTPG